jgi:hypothetical protein
MDFKPEYLGKTTHHNEFGSLIISNDLPDYVIADLKKSQNHKFLFNERENNTNSTGSGDTGSGDTGSGDTGSGDTGSGSTGSGNRKFAKNS